MYFDVSRSQMVNEMKLNVKNEDLIRIGDSFLGLSLYHPTFIGEFVNILLEKHKDLIFPVCLELYNHYHPNCIKIVQDYFPKNVNKIVRNISCAY